MTLLLGSLSVALALALTGVLWRLLNPPPRVVVGKRGILDRALRLGWIPWDEIEGAFPPTARESEAVRLRVRVTERLTRALRRSPLRSRWPEPLPPSVDIPLDLAGTELSPVELLRDVVARSDRTVGRTGDAGLPEDARAGG